MSSVAALAGRILLSLLFLLSGLQKLFTLDAVGTYAASAGLPASLALPAALFEIVAGLFVLTGLMTRLTALALAAFCLLTALLFHNRVDDPAQAVQALKNIAIAGGFLMLFAYGNTRSSFDTYRQGRRDALRDRDERLGSAAGTHAGPRGNTVVPPGSTVVEPDGERYRT